MTANPGIDPEPCWRFGLRESVASFEVLVCSGFLGRRPHGPVNSNSLAAHDMNGENPWPEFGESRLKASAYWPPLLHQLIRIPGFPNKGPIDAQRSACRELMPLMASGTVRWIVPETRVQSRAA
jgi:hypothetical protein